MKIQFNLLEVNTIKKSFTKLLKAVDKTNKEAKLVKGFKSDFKKLEDKGTITKKIGSVSLGEEGLILTLNTNFVCNFSNLYFKSSEELIKPLSKLSKAVKKQQAVFSTFMEDWKDKPSTTASEETPSQPYDEFI